MYYRYKSKKKNYLFFKITGTLILVGAVMFPLVKYREHLYFWKYTQNKLMNQVEKANNILTREERQKALLELESSIEEIKRDNPVKADIFYLSGMYHYYLGSSFMKEDFFQLFIKDEEFVPDNKSKEHFVTAIKDIKKGRALTRGSVPESKYLFVLAKSLYILSYYTPGEICKNVLGCEGDISAKSDENVRFFALMKILNNRVDQGIDYLKENDSSVDSIEGQLFLASALREGRRHTDAIMNYESVLKKTNNIDIKKTIHLNIGKIYYYQSLYRESLEHFMYCYNLDADNEKIGRWVVKNYDALGEKKKMKEFLSNIGKNKNKIN